MQLCSCLLVLMISRGLSVTTPWPPLIERNDLLQHSGFSETGGSSSILDKYRESIEQSLTSLLKAFDGGAFYFDALKYTLQSTQTLLYKLVGISSDECVDDEGGSYINFGEYERLIHLAADSDFPGSINLEHASQQRLEGYHADYVRNNEVVYVENILDSETFEKVCNIYFFNLIV